MRPQCQSSAAEALAPTPQFVSITFDDNFGLAAPGAVGGVRAVTEFFAGKHNPTGTGNEAVFDGTPISTTFFNMCVYMVDRSGKVIGGYRGEDWKGHNRSAWKAAFAAGNEMADHTVNHFNGGTAPINQDDCCRARDWDFAHWTNEIDAARKLMTDRQYGLGAKNVIGFRAPYLSFNDAMFSSLQTRSGSFMIPACQIASPMMRMVATALGPICWTTVALMPRASRARSAHPRIEFRFLESKTIQGFGNFPSPA